MAIPPLKDFSSTLEFLKQPFFALVATIILGAVLLFNGAGNFLGFDSYRPIVGILFILSLCVLLSQLVAQGWAVIHRWHHRRSVVIKCIDRLHQLTDDEKSVLRRYIHGHTRTQNLDINSGVTAGLERAGIIVRMSTISSDHFAFPYNITDFAWNYLNVYPSILAD